MTIMRAGMAALSYRPSELNSKTLIARVSHPKGLNKYVAGNSFITSTATTHTTGLIRSQWVPIPIPIISTPILILSIIMKLHISCIH